MNPLKEMLWSVSVYTKPGNQLSHIILPQNCDPLRSRNFTVDRLLHRITCLHMKQTSIPDESKICTDV